MSKKARIKGERNLILPDYTKWLRDNYSGEIHHYIPRSHIGTNDFFVVMLPPADHHAIHHESGPNPRQWADARGMEDLIIQSIDMMSSWVEETNHQRREMFIDALFSIYTCPTREHAIKVTRQLATRLKDWR